MTEKTKGLDIDLSFKKNNVDELFFNLSEMVSKIRIFVTH